MDDIRFDIRRYTPSLADEWNAFVAQSKNGTFLFDRRYMDYHADRFSDCSLLFYRAGRLHALLPAHAAAALFSSHGGLTYGGLVTDRHFAAAEAVPLFTQLNDWLRQTGFRRVVYKPVPHIYHVLPAEADLYALHHVCHARLTGRDIGTDIVRRRAPRWERVRRRGVRRAQEAGISVRRTDDYAAFWRILADNLGSRYGVQPVHTLEEIELLAGRFPDNIALFGAYRDGVMLGGLVLYITTQVVHAQYSSATDEGKALGVMDMIYDHVLREEYTDRPHFDFGRSTEGPAGDVLNARLTFQKEGYGGRTVVYDTYEYTL